MWMISVSYTHLDVYKRQTLRGRVLAIGGLKEKLLAAKTAGMKTVLVPKENEKDVEEISREIKNGLDIILVESMEEVIKHAFVSQ